MYSKHLIVDPIKGKRDNYKPQVKTHDEANGLFID